MRIELKRSYRIQPVGSPILCAELRQRLVYEPNFVIPNHIISDSENLFAALYEVKPDIVLLDMTLDWVSLYGCLVQMQEQLDVAPYVVAIAPDYEPHLETIQDFRPLVRGTLLRRMALTELLRPLMRGIATGCEYFLPRPLHGNEIHLTNGEYSVLLLMALGMDNGQLERELHTSRQAIYNHQSRIRIKLDVQTNQKAVVTAIRLGLVGVFTGPEDPTEPGMCMMVNG